MNYRFLIAFLLAGISAARFVAASLVITAPASVVPGDSFDYTYTLTAEQAGTYLMNESLPHQVVIAGTEAPSGGFVSWVGSEVSWEMVNMPAQSVAKFIIKVKVPQGRFSCGSTSIVTNTHFYTPHGYLPVNECSVEVSVIPPRVSPLGIVSAPGHPIVLKGPTGNYTYRWLKDGNELPSQQSLHLPGEVSDTGLYTLIVTDSSGCSSSSSMPVTVSKESQDVVEGGYTYEWFKDGAIVQQATSKKLSLQGLSTDSGVYTLKVTDSATGCADEATMQLKVSSCSGSGMRD